jgi:hypothetical protein
VYNSKRGENMPTNMELSYSLKRELARLIRIKRANAGKTVSGLEQEIEDMVATMQQEDVAWVEKTLGVKAIDN